MIDTQNVGQELQDQVLAAARKGQQRVKATVKTVRATAQQIRPQLPSLPKATLNAPSLPTPAQIREKAPALAAMAENAEQFRASAHEFAGQIRSAQRKVIDQVVEQVRSVTTPLVHQAESHELAGQFLAMQRKVVDQVVEQVRSVTTPLAHQAAAVFAQAAKPAGKATATVAEPSELADVEHAKTEPARAEHAKTEHAKTEHVRTEHVRTEHGKAEHADTEHGKATGQHNGGSARKPRTRSTAK